ncbi:hypothetical protein FOBRF1_007755 [Fusarium oxysporum]
MSRVTQLQGERFVNSVWTLDHNLRDEERDKGSKALARVKAASRKRKASFKSDQLRKKIAENQSKEQNKYENKAEYQAVPSEDDDEDFFTFGYSDDDMPAKLEPKSEGSDDGEGIDIKEEDSKDAY